MADVIDELAIEISASSRDAEASINRLVRRLDSLTASIGNLQTQGITNLANSVNQLSASMRSMNDLRTTDFTRLARNITRLSSVNNGGIFSLSTSLNRLITSLNSLGDVNQSAQNVGVLANGIAQLGYRRVATAIQNLPALATGLNNLITTLSNAPRVNDNIIRMTNALANLASQGARVGTASNSLVRGLNRYTTASNRASKSTFSLAAAFGKFYASYFLIIRGLKGVWSSIEGAAGYIESFNYYSVAFEKIASEWDEQWEEYGNENAKRYSNAFIKEMNNTLQKMSGVQLEMSEDFTSGVLSDTGLKNLGMNIREVTQFASQLASVTNSVGQVGEVSLATAESLTMLAGDISSLFNIDFKDVAKNLQSGLIGQSRALYRYGIDITNATLQTYAYGLGLEKSVSEMTQAEKMQLRLIAILDQSKVSWGDLANTIQSPSNQIRMLTNNISELGMVFGQLFIPMLSKVLPYVNGLTIALKRLFVNLASFMGIDIDLDAFGQGYNDSLDDTADGFDEVADSIEKTNKALRGFDELKTISSANTVSLSGVNETGNTIDLTDEIKKASEEYQRVWNEAFAQMENRAEDFADNISLALAPLNNIFEHLSLGEWETAGEDFTEIVNGITGFLTEAIADVDWSAIGNNIGDFLKGIDWTSILSSIGDLIYEAIQAAIDLWEGAFNAAPIETSIVSAIALLSFQGISLPMLIPAITSAITTALANGILIPSLLVSIGAFAITSPIGMEIGQRILSNFEEWVADNFGQGVVDAIGASLMLTSGVIIGGSLGGPIGAIVGAIISGILAIFATDESAQDFASGVIKFIGNGLDEAVKKIFNFDKTKTFASATLENFRKAFEGESFGEIGINIVKGIGNGIGTALQFLLEPIQDLFDWTWEYICEAFGITNGKSASKMEGIGENIINGIIEGISNASDFIEKALKELWNGVANWFNEKLTWDIEPIRIFGKTVFEGATINLGRLPTFATGGFPEDGLFYANHSELVGQFSNGRTAVANNQQITDGIAKAVYPAVYQAVKEAMGTGSNQEIRVFVGDRELTDIAIDGINRRTMATGKTPLQLAF